jgi:hypothetical protein
MTGSVKDLAFNPYALQNTVIVTGYNKAVFSSSQSRVSELSMEQFKDEKSGAHAPVHRFHGFFAFSQTQRNKRLLMANNCATCFLYQSSRETGMIVVMVGQQEVAYMGCYDTKCTDRFPESIVFVGISGIDQQVSLRTPQQVAFGDSQIQSVETLANVPHSGSSENSNAGRLPGETVEQRTIFRKSEVG